MGLADAITKGISFGPWECMNPVNVLFLDGEMAAQDVIRRLQDLGTESRKTKLFIYSDSYAHMKGLSRASLLNPKWRDGLLDFMLNKEVKLWICDNVASLTPGADENSKCEWDPINQWLLKLRFSGISSAVVHHEGRSGNQRGTSSREDNVDICISLKRPSDYLQEQGARFIASFTKSRMPIEYLSLISDTEFQLERTMGDIYEWTWKNVKKQNKLEVLRMFDDGISGKDISEILGISKGRVSQIKAEAIKAGFLTRKGNLTQLGFQQVEN
jgi:putative DNA primase/helicase